MPGLLRAAGIGISTVRCSASQRLMRIDVCHEHGAGTFGIGQMDLGGQHIGRLTLGLFRLVKAEGIVAVQWYRHSAALAVLGRRSFCCGVRERFRARGQREWSSELASGSLKMIWGAACTCHTRRGHGDVGDTGQVRSQLGVQLYVD